MTKIIRWLIKKFLPGYHLAKDPAKRKAVAEITKREIPETILIKEGGIYEKRT